jgi:UDPglucose 6-dehydrogenase
LGLCVDAAARNDDFRTDVEDNDCRTNVTRKAGANVRVGKERTLMRVSIVGLGKLGSPMAACFSSKGFTVVGCDVNEDYVNAVRDARPPVFEPDLAERFGAGKAYLSATTDLAAAVAATDVTFVVVPTPSETDGGFSLRFVLPAMETIGKALADKEDYHLVVLTSTVMPGATGGAVLGALEEASGKSCGDDFGLCYSPEFIALGSVIRDFLNPDFLLVGESDARAGELLADLYGRVCDNDAPVARMNFVNAELAKISVNTFVTTKIAFANMLARVCERLPGADVDAVTSALGMDSRIGSKYLRGAISYGGPCFPRDNIAFAALARALSAPAFVAEATDVSNRDGIDRLGSLVADHVPSGGSVAVLGLSYKPNTDVVDESPGVRLASQLAEEGLRVTVYDPAAMANAHRILGEAVEYAESAEAAITSSDVIVLATPWSEFLELESATFEREGQPRVLIDCWRIVTGSVSDATTYVPLGQGPARDAAIALD